VVQPGDPIKLTFPGDRANHIEDQTTGGLAKEAGHVDNTGGGSIHFQNGSNSWYIFHAGPTCGTYTWNHQSPGAGCTCNVSANFTVCGNAPPPAAVVGPTAIPPSPTAETQQQVEEPTSVPEPTTVAVEPTQPVLIIVPPTIVPSRFFSIPTGSSEQISPSAGQSASPQAPLSPANFKTIFSPLLHSGERLIAQTKTITLSGKDFFMKFISAFLSETNF